MPFLYVKSKRHVFPREIPEEVLVLTGQELGKKYNIQGGDLHRFRCALKKILDYLELFDGSLSLGDISKKMGIAKPTLRAYLTSINSTFKTDLGSGCRDIAEAIAKREGMPMYQARQLVNSFPYIEFFQQGDTVLDLAKKIGWRPITTQNCWTLLHRVGLAPEIPGGFKRYCGISDENPMHQKAIELGLSPSQIEKYSAAMRNGRLETLLSQELTKDEIADRLRLSSTTVDALKSTVLRVHYIDEIVKAAKKRNLSINPKQVNNLQKSEITLEAIRNYDILTEDYPDNTIANISDLTRNQVSRQRKVLTILGLYDPLSRSAKFTRQTVFEQYQNRGITRPESNILFYGIRNKDIFCSEMSDTEVAVKMRIKIPTVRQVRRILKKYHAH